MPCIFYVDDYLTSGKMADTARERLYCIRDTAIAWGWRWNQAKEEVGQVICFVGILINTIRMVISFDAMSTTAFTVELTGYLVTL